MKRWAPIAAVSAVLCVPTAVLALTDSGTPVSVGAAAPSARSTATPATITTAAPARTTAAATAAKAAAAAPAAEALAARTCREDAVDDPAEFRADHGAGPSAIARCVGAELHKARLECAQDAIEDPADFRAEHGATGLTGCVRDKVG